MKHETKIKFVKSREEDGAALYNLVDKGKVIERDLDIQQVVERINAGVDDVSPGPSQRPEDRRRKRVRRCR